MQNPDSGDQDPQTGGGSISMWWLRHSLAVEHNLVVPRIGHNVEKVALLELSKDATEASNANPHVSATSLNEGGEIQAWETDGKSFFLITIEPQLSGQFARSLSSSLCGKYVSSLSEIPTRTVRSFFCAEHYSDGDTYRGGRGLMRAVTLQLVSTMQAAEFPAPKSNNPPNLVQQLEAGDLETIISVFTTALDQKPEATVFVLIDRARWNDTGARGEEMCSVVQFLHGEVERLNKADSGPALKVLVTNPSPSQMPKWKITGKAITLDRQACGCGCESDEGQVIADVVSGLDRLASEDAVD